MKKRNIVSIILLILILGIIMTLPGSYSAPEKPPGQGSSSNSVSHKGATEISEETTLDDQSYSSTNGSENALLVEKAKVTMNSCEINKSGDSDGDEADFYGTNAALFAYNKAILTITDATITTNGAHANAVFAYDTGVINIAKSTIKTSKNNSGGIMVTGGGVLTASSLKVETDGNSSAAIRSDRGGGTINIEGGTFTTNGQGSPAIYSTADITVKDANLISNQSEGVVVEGKNSVTLDNCSLDDNNTTLNGNSTTYKNIFLYQSMSGDASVGVSSFEAKDSDITTNKGDTFYVTNTSASITLENNHFINIDGDFLRIEAAKWGTSGSNGGEVDLTLKNQSVEGNIIVDSISTLDMKLENNSSYTGAINNKNQAKNISLTLSKDSKLSLDGDTYISSLENEDATNSNITLNGYKLYVNDSELEVSKSEQEKSKIEKETRNLIKYVVIVVSVVAITSICVFLLIKKTRKTV